MRKLTLVLLIAVATNLSCGPTERGESHTEEGTPGTGLPAIGTDTLWVEGQPEVLTIQRYASEPDFPLPFETRIPSGISVESVSSGEGNTILFLAIFGGETRDSVRLAFTVLPDNHQPTATESLVRELARRGSDVRDSQGPRWAVTFARRDGREAAGWVGSGSRNDHTFLLNLDYPPEFGDGFEPRASYILQHWVWLDPSESLGHPASMP
jgi:hypothetical protein